MLTAALNVSTGEVPIHLRKGHTGADVLRLFKNRENSRCFAPTRQCKLPIKRLGGLEGNVHLPLSAFVIGECPVRFIFSKIFSG